MNISIERYAFIFLFLDMCIYIDQLNIHICPLE